MQSVSWPILIISLLVSLQTKRVSGPLQLGRNMTYAPHFCLEHYITTDINTFPLVGWDGLKLHDYCIICSHASLPRLDVVLPITKMVLFFPSLFVDTVKLYYDLTS